MSHPSRPWYCIDPLVDEYRLVVDIGADFRMLRGLKIARSIIVNVGLFIIIISAIREGVASPGIVGLAILTIGLYNGIELADYHALAQAVLENQAGVQSGEHDENGE